METTTLLLVILIGIAAGLLSGLVGVGGGLIIVPALVYFLGLSQHTAQGTSLAMIMLPVGIFGVINYYKQGHVDFRIVGLLAAGFIVGSFFGSKVALNLSQENIKRFFAGLMMLVAIKMMFFDKPAKVTAPIIETQKK